jgi:hypothetical protein
VIPFVGHTGDPIKCWCSICWNKRVLREDGEVDTLLPKETE